VTDPVRRNNYFCGKVLTAEHFQVEQDYHRDMRHRQNQLQGSGVVTGLEVSVEKPWTVVVSPGWAIDRLGREIVLTESVRLDASTTGTPEFVVTAAWAEEPASPVPALDGSCDAQYDYIEERPRIEIIDASSVDPLAVILGQVRRKRNSIGHPDRARREQLRPRRDSPGPDL
jgi:hypothetical protein